MLLKETMWSIDNSCAVNSSSPAQNGRHFKDEVFKRIFLNEKVWIISKIYTKYTLYTKYTIYTKICSEMSNWQKPGIGLDNGLAPNRRQAITWTNADSLHLTGRWVKYHSVLLIL